MFWVDSEASFQRVKEVACRSVGYTRDELIFMRVYDIDPDYQAENWSEH